MKNPTAKIIEHNYLACNGTEFQAVSQPVQPGRRIFPARCTKCDGKGRMNEDVN